jgi:glucan phosphoethanolaminetransferase (alkaline phosphatase superfamily)
MGKRGQIILGILGLAVAVLSTLFYTSAVQINDHTTFLSVGSIITGALAAVFAVVILLAHGRAHNYVRLGLPLLAVVAFLSFSSSLSSFYIGTRIDPKTQADHGAAHTTQFIIALIIGAVVYLIAATIYGFVGKRQGVKVGARIGLLLLLLLAVVPLADVVGLLGFIIVAIVRKPIVVTEPASDGEVTELTDEEPELPDEATQPEEAVATEDTSPLD